MHSTKLTKYVIARRVCLILKRKKKTGGFEVYFCFSKISLAIRKLEMAIGTKVHVIFTLAFEAWLLQNPTRDMIAVHWRT